MKKYELSHQKNIRDLGGLIGHEGKRIKYGRIFRGGALTKLTKEDIEVLETFHLTDVVDFRGNDEFYYNPDHVLIGVTYHSFPAIEERVKVEDRKKDDGNLLWFVTDNTSGFDHLKRQYRDLITMKKSQTAYRNFFKVLLSEDRVVYYHCSQGKDRAGLASFFIETALGVDMNDMLDDYMLSQVAMDKKIDKLINDVKNKPFYNEEYRQSLIDIFSVKLEYINAAIEEMIKISGSPLNYIKEVLEVDIDKLRKLYLE